MSLAVVFSLIQKSLWYSNSFYSFVEIAPCGVRGKSMISFNLISIQQRKICGYQWSWLWFPICYWWGSSRICSWSFIVFVINKWLAWCLKIPYLSPICWRNIYCSYRNLNDLKIKLNHELDQLLSAWMKSSRLALSILKTNLILFRFKNWNHTSYLV